MTTQAILYKHYFEQENADEYENAALRKVHEAFLLIEKDEVVMDQFLCHVFNFCNILECKAYHAGLNAGLQLFGTKEFDWKQTCEELEILHAKKK